MYLIAAREKFQILKNGSVYPGAWPPLQYNAVESEWIWFRQALQLYICPPQLAIHTENISYVSPIRATFTFIASVFPQCLMWFHISFIDFITPSRNSIHSL